MKFQKTLLCVWLIAIATTVFAQQNNGSSSSATKHDLQAELPLNPKITKGKLENGLSYFIQKNQKPEKRAVFFLAVDAGAVLETDAEAGLAHFTEHLGFNGTKQFPGNSLIDELEKKGIYFGGDINASTGYNMTNYYVVLPTDDSTMLDKGLQILDGWAFGMLMTDEEIDKERGVIIEEWRTYLGAYERLQQKTMPIELKGSRYPHHDVIGTLENLQNFKYETVRGFYKKWYRPENMAIIIVGDIDVADMEKRIQNFFRMNDKPSTPFERPIMSIPDNVEPLIAIATDPEATSTDVCINFKHAPTPHKTYGDFRNNIILSLYEQMLDSRIYEIGQKKTAPFIYGYSFFGSYWSEDNEAFSHYFEAKDGKSLASLEIILTELRRVQQHGFTETELQRAKDELRSQYEKAVKEEGKTESRWLCYSIGYYFAEEGSSLTSDSLDLVLADEFLPSITINEVNKVSDEWIHDENITVTITMPETKGVKVPTEKQVIDIMEKCKRMNTKPYIDNVNTSPFLVKEPQTGKVISRSENDKYDCTEIQLSNGAKVVLKKTDFQNDEILMAAYSKGGTSLYPDKQFVNADNAADVIRECGIGNYSPNDYEKYMKGKNYSLYPYISDLCEGISGRSTIRDFEYMLQELYMTFEAPRKDEEVFERLRTECLENAKLIPNSPEYQFSINYYKERYPNNSRFYALLTEKHISQMNLDEMFKIFRERFSNAADFTFILVGNLEESTVIPLIEKYIGGISSSEKREQYMDRTPEFAIGKVEKTFHLGIAEKSEVGIATRIPFNFNDREDLAFDVLTDIVDIKLTEVIREKMSGTYGTGFSISCSRIPQAFVYMSISLGCDPERIEELTNAIWAEIDRIIENGPTQTDLDKVKEQMIRHKEISWKQNNSWLFGLANYFVFDTKFYTLDEYRQAVNSFTIEEIKEAAKYMKHDEYVRCILMPGK